jgi:hypothetical protein
MGQQGEILIDVTDAAPRELVFLTPTTAEGEAAQREFFTTLPRVRSALTIDSRRAFGLNSRRGAATAASRSKGRAPVRSASWLGLFISALTGRFQY